MNALAQKPFDVDAYCRRAAAIRNRLMRPQIAVRPSLVSTTGEVENRATRRPLWRTTPIAFNAHVLTWQSYLAQSRTSRYLVYIKRRCQEMGVDYEYMMAGSSRRDIVRVRQLVMFEMKSEFGLSWTKLGEIFGLDHSTAIHAVRKMAALLGTDVPERQKPEFVILNDLDLKARMRRDYEVVRVSLETMSERYAVSIRTIKNVAEIENWQRLKQTHYVTPRDPVAHRISISSIRAEYEAGDLSFNRIAINHGISYKTVQRLAARNGWERRAQP